MGQEDRQMVGGYKGVSKEIDTTKRSKKKKGKQIGKKELRQTTRAQVRIQDTAQ
jgi:hypothetical protein